MPYSQLPAVQILTEIFLQAGISEIVISPGSRNGALIAHFHAHPKINCHSIPDERSAGFFALGMAQRLRIPVALCCTSGSAVANYYPAVVEAFYQNVPLLVLSADRPQKIIDQFDGQTIRQAHIFEQHAHAFLGLNGNETVEESAIIETIQKAIQYQGPVHINMSFEEPFYIFQNEISLQTQQKFSPAEIKFPHLDWSQLKKEWENAARKLILVGQHHPEEIDKNKFLSFAKKCGAVVLTENISNCGHETFFNHIDRLLFSLKDEELEELQPDLLLTIGQNVVSKKVKQFLRKFSPQYHWHLNPHWQPDTFGALTQKIPWDFPSFYQQFSFEESPSSYAEKWNKIREIDEKHHQEFKENVPFSDWWVYDFLSSQLNPDIQIQWGNSSPIRYAQFFEISGTHFSNRGTSGIDGCTSTAIGACMATQKKTLLISGDISFLYDINAWWNSSIPSNFKAIVLDNGGGKIFDFIPGPNESGAPSFFQTPHDKDIAAILKAYGFMSHKVSSKNEILEKWNDFISDDSQPQILVIDTKNQPNTTVLKSYLSKK